MSNVGELLGKKPTLEESLLLGYALGKNRAYLFAHAEYTLTQEQLQSYQALLLQYQQGVPLAYLTGEREFWSLTLKVNQHTLIPRHETELLVELALTHLPQDNLHILELGTGSGAIALALAKEKPSWHITACDLSKEALEVAQENAQRHGLTNVSFRHSNWFEKVPQRRYHAIVSNPPYIAEHDPHLNQGDLRFEPRCALASSQNGLADLQFIIKHSPAYLIPNGLLLLEHGYDQKDNVLSILNEYDYQHTKCWQDIQGNDRVSGGWNS